MRGYNILPMVKLHWLAALMRGYNILPKVKLRWLAALMRGNISLDQKTIYIKTAQQGDAPATSAIKNPTPCSVASLLPPRLGIFNSTGPGDL